MASLYIKDPVTAGRVERLARQRGTTKTALVGRALDALEQIEGEAAPPGAETPPSAPLEWIRWHRARKPLPTKVGNADKAFFDRLWGEPD